MARHGHIYIRVQIGVSTMKLTSYFGNIKSGKKDGQGTYRYPNGDKYVGKWRDNKFTARAP